MPPKAGAVFKSETTVGPGGYRQYRDDLNKWLRLAGNFACDFAVEGVVMRPVIRRFGPVFLTVALLLAVPLVFLACTSVTWLPDSSGFVYVDWGGNVILYDIKKKSRKQIAKVQLYAGDATLSPDGKQIAVVAAVPQGQNKVEVRFDFYDLRGKRLKRGKPVVVQQKKSQQQIGVLQTEMSSDNRHLVAFLGTASSAVLYDKKTDKSLVIQDVMQIPGYSPVWPISVRHTSPDGKGFIAIRGFGASEPKLAYFTWDGAASVETKIPKEIEGVAEKVDFQNNAAVLTRPIWKGTVLTARAYEGLLRFDAKKGELTYVQDAATAKLAKHARKHKVIVLCELADGALLQVKDSKLLQIHRPGKDLLEVASLSEQNPTTVVPSPNGKFVFARTFGKAQSLHVVSTSGEIILSDKK